MNTEHVTVATRKPGRWRALTVTGCGVSAVVSQWMPRHEAERAALHAALQGPLYAAVMRDSAGEGEGYPGEMEYLSPGALADGYAQDLSMRRQPRQLA